jgi:hypothetical protein
MMIEGAVTAVVYTNRLKMMAERSMSTARHDYLAEYLASEGSEIRD